jgi:hypothetical protein
LKAEKNQLPGSPLYQKMPGISIGGNYSETVTLLSIAENKHYTTEQGMPIRQTR